MTNRGMSVVDCNTECMSVHIYSTNCSPVGPHRSLVSGSLVLSSIVYNNPNKQATQQVNSKKKPSHRFTNSPELLLLKNLPLSDHHSHFWAATFDFTTFFMLPFFAWAASFFTVWLDFTSFCNLTNLCCVAGG